MSLQCEHVFLWETTPHDLRGIAEAMEKQERRSTPGDCKIVHRVWGKNQKLEIMFDQEDAAKRGNDWTTKGATMTMQEERVMRGFAIVVADRGFVYVGEAAIGEEWCVLSSARNVRCWGTTRGLGELALNGPTDKTKMDDVGTVRIPMRAVISVIDTVGEKWTR